MEKEQHLEEETSQRGFSLLPPITGEYGGKISIRESSAATDPHLWVMIDDQSEAKDATTVHLTAENAWKLAEQLMFAVKNHYQGDSRPEESDRFADIKENKS